jgi:hypothetical protein
MKLILAACLLVSTTLVAAPVVDRAHREVRLA